MNTRSLFRHLGLLIATALLADLGLFRGQAQVPLARQVPEGVELVWNLPEALGVDATRLARQDPHLNTGGRVAGIWTNDRWAITTSADGSVDVFQRITPETTEAAGSLPLDPVGFGELAQAVIKVDDAILLSRSGNVVVYRLQPFAAGGHVQVGQLVGPLPPMGFTVSGTGRRSGPGVNVDYLYVPAGAEGVAIYDLTLEWFPRAVRTLQAARRFGQLGLEEAPPIGAPVSVAALTDVLAVTTGGRDIRLFEEFFLSTWETVDRGGWQAGEGETVSLLSGQLGRLYAVVGSAGGARLQAFSVSNRLLTPRGSLALPGALDFTAMERFGTDFLALARRQGGIVVVSVANLDRLETITDLAALDGAETTTLSTDFPHLWANDRPTDASHLILSNVDSALAHYASEGELPVGMTLTAAGVLRWTPGEDRGGTRVNVPFIRTIAGTTNHLVAEVRVEEANQAPVIDPVADQQLVAGRPWTLNVAVADADMPAQVLSLTSDHPDIVVGDRRADGTFPLVWTPLAAAEATTVTLIARDDAGGSATQRFQLAVASGVRRLDWSEHAVPAPADLWPASLIPPRDGQHAVFSLSEGQLPSGVGLDVSGMFSGAPDESAGGSTTSFRVTAQLAGETSHLFYTVTVAEVDDPPEISPIRDQSYAYGVELVIPLAARDPDSQAVGFNWSATAVSGMAGIPDLGALPIINGRIRWTPDPEGPRLGSYWVTVEAVERHAAEGEGQPETTGLTNRTTFVLAPTLENLAPYWADPQPLVQLQASEGQPVHFPRLRVLDPNGPAGRIESYGTVGPDGVPGFPFAPQADGTVQIPDWTPREDAGGRTWQFTLVANDIFDQSLKATNVIAVEVAEVNGPPIWRPVPVQQGIVGRELALDLPRFVFDPDRIWVGDSLVPDPLTFRLIPGNPIPGNPTVTPDGHLTWTPESFAGCGGQLLSVEVRDSAGNTALGRILLAVQPLIPLSSAVTNRLDGIAPNQVNHLVANAVLGWDLGHDLSWLTGVITNSPGTCFAQANCFLKAYRSLSWPGARPDAVVLQNRLNGDPSFPLANVESRGIARLTNLVALPRTAALLGDDHGGLWLRFGEYYLGRALDPAETDVEGVDWGYSAAHANEWRIYRAKPARNQGPVQRAEIWYYDVDGNGFRLVQTVGAQPLLHLNIGYNVLSNPNDDTITAWTEEGQMEVSFNNPGRAAGEAFARGLAAVLAEELADRRLSFRMDQLTAVDTDLLAQAAIQCALLDPDQPICGQYAPMGLYTANGAILISGCDNLSATNRPPDLQPIGVIPVAPGDVLSVQLRATDPDVPAQPLTFSLDAESVRRGLQVNPVTGLLTWNVPADAGCSEISGTATVQDPEPLADSEPFTIRILPRQFAVQFAGEEPDQEGLLATESSGGYRLDWLPVADGALPPMAARRWSSPESLPVYAARFHPNAPAPVRGAHFTWGDRNTLPRTQRVLRSLGLNAETLGFRFDFQLADIRKGMDWGYDPVTATEWRHYTGTVEITLEDTTLFHLAGQTLSARLNYGNPANPEDNHITATTGLLVLAQPEGLLGADAAAVAAAFQDDLGDGITRLNFSGIRAARTLDLIDKGFPVTWHDLAGALEVFSCEPPYVAPYLVSPGNVTVDEGTLAQVEFRTIPANPGNLQFRLVAPPDPRMRLTEDGKFQWPTGENDGGRSVAVTVEMTDGITVMESQFVVTVRELNSAPVLFEIAAQTVSPGSVLRVRLNVMDSDRPRQNLTLSLDAESLRRGFQLDPATGLVTWRPGPLIQAGFATEVEARVSDGLLDAVRRFRVTVLPSLVAVVGMRALDGYLAGATVWWDANLDGQLDSNEPRTTTDRGGNFELQLDLATWDRNGDGRLGPADGRLVATGGLDLMTGLPFGGRLTAPADAAVISPLTSLLERLTRDGALPETAAQGRLRECFGLPPGIDVAAMDPLPAAAAGDPAALRMQAINVLIADTVSQLAATLEGHQKDLNPKAATDILLDTWADRIRRRTVPSDGSSASVRGLLTDSARVVEISLPDEVAAAVAETVGVQNEAKQEAAAEPDGLERLARLQAGSLVESSPSLRALGAGVLTADDVRIGQSAWLRHSLTAMPSGDPLGAAESPGRFGLSRSQVTVREDGVSDQVLAVVRSDGAAGTAMVEIGLLDSVNRLLTNRLVLAFRDGERFRTVDWSAVLANDSDAIPGRTITATLTTVTSVPAGASLAGNTSAVATVLDDEQVGRLEFSMATYRHDSARTSGLTVVRRGGIAGRVVGRVTFAADGIEVPALDLEFPAGVSRRIVPLPALLPSAGAGPKLSLSLSLVPGTDEGGSLGTITEALVDYAATGTALRILHLEKTVAGTVRITTVGPAGVRHRIESSSDLVSWQPAAEGGEVVTQGETPVSAAIPTSAPARFLRLRPVVEF